MSTQSNAVPQSPLGSEGSVPAAMSPTRPLYWSVRRELWENRSIYLAPLAVAAMALLGFVISAFHLPERRRAVLQLDLAQQQVAIEVPYDITAIVIILTAFIVGVFYCLDALHGERRDRSILFWKSLPVSDLVTVLSKASIPLVVLPLLSFVIIFAMQVIILLLTNAILLMNGLPATTWEQLPLFQQSLTLLYGIIVLVLWHAPLYGWLLLVSAWARRAAFLWAVLPLVAISVLEKLAFNTWHFGHMLKDRLTGFAPEAFVFDGVHRIPVVAQLTPGTFLSAPGLWLGLAAAALLLAAAVRQRRYRGPI